MLDIRAIQIRFSEKFAGFFDTIINCRISNRKSDIGFIEKDRPTLGPRPGTSRIGNTIINDWNNATAYVVGNYVVSGGIIYVCTNNNTNSLPPSANWTAVSTATPIQSKTFFYTDRAGTRRQYRVFDKRLQYLNGSTWTNLKTLTGNDVDFSTQRVPMNTTTSDSTSRTVAGVATTSERVKRDAGDTLGANNNIGTIILITSGIYKGCYAPIISYDSGTDEYLLGGAGIITPLAASTTYKRYDTIGDALQICRGQFNEKELYFNGITEMTWLEGFTTDSLINISAMTTGQGLKKMVAFNNYSWTFAGSTLYYTGGYPGNPLFFNYTGTLTLGGNSSIVDIFQYKNRLVVQGSNFIFSIQKDFSVDRHITSFGGIRDGYVNIGDDVYIFTTQKTLISLQETINGVVTIKNAGEEIDNYLRDFNTNIAFGFDSNRIYLYGEEVSSSGGNMCVYDIKRKIWIIYTGIRPRSMVAEGSSMYMTDIDSDICRVFDESIATDVAIGTSKTTTIAQAFTLKEIDLSDIFSPKALTSIYFSFENYTQSIAIDTYMAINRLNGKKKTGTISVSEIPVGGGTLGQGNIGNNTFGESGMLDIISVPLMAKIEYNADPANIFKVGIQATGSNPFYINQMDIMIGFSQTQKTYFDPSSTQ